MAAFREGKVTKIVSAAPSLVRASVSLGASELGCVAFPAMVGDLSVGDRVVVNTTGIELELGTGGDGFILWNLDGGEIDPGVGHIVKLRYTPWQTEVLAVEAPESEHHVRLKEADDLAGCPVVACGLHSQLVGVVAGIKSVRADARIGYVMSDGGALPIAWSHLVKDLKAREQIDLTCTYGHAFGGDLEAVNLFSALVATRELGNVDVIIAGMGPGGVGTGTRLGFSGIEQGQILDATSALGGRAVACVRVSFGDERERHRGISHHSVTALTLGAARRATVVLPLLDPGRMDLLRTQCELSEIASRHEVVEADGSSAVDRLREGLGLVPDTMGRSIDSWPEPFLASGAAGIVAAGLVGDGGHSS